MLKTTKAKNILMDILFPKLCLNCQKEGSYLCKDCFSLIDILECQFCPACQKRVADGRTCPKCSQKTKLDGLYFASSYQDKLIKKLISKFKDKPFIKDLSETLSLLIIAHFHRLDNFQSLEKSVFTSVPLHKKQLKKRGFNQSKEIAKELSKTLEIPFVDALVKTLPLQQGKSLEGTFLCKDIKKIQDKKVFLVDDVFITGVTMNECAKILKKSGAKEVWGIAVAREEQLFSNSFLI